jgi:hypothetical protein
MIISCCHPPPKMKQSWKHLYNSDTDIKVNGVRSYMSPNAKNLKICKSRSFS